MSDDSAGFIFFIILALIVSWIYFIFWWEQEWIIKDKYSCKEVIKIDDEWYKRIFTKYTCDYYYANNWKIIWWYCWKAEYNNNWICIKLTEYSKKPEVKCSKEAFLNKVEGICKVCNKWYKYNKYAEKCFLDNSKKYEVNINDYRFSTLNTSKSSFINGAWYDEDNEYLILKLKNTYYHYCWVNKSIWNSFKQADSFGKYFNIYIKDKFDCRVWKVPVYE